MSAWETYKAMCKDLRESGCSTEGMYMAYLHGELRQARERIRELEGQAT